MGNDSTRTFVPNQCDKNSGAIDPKERIRCELIRHYAEQVDGSLGMTIGDSPIENILFLAVWAQCEMDHIIFARRGYEYLRRQTPEIVWEAQAPIEGYRIDFVFRSLERAVAVECDGHDFHERTKAQARRDRSRDRRLQELGFKVFRFTGSEIYHDPMACAVQITTMLGW